MEIRVFQPADETAVIDIWSRCGLLRAWNDPRKDIARKLSVQPELFLVGTENDRIVGTVMAGYDGHRGWINYLAVDPESRRQGYGRALMGAVEQCLQAVGCPKINLQIRQDNLAATKFYARIGFAPDAVVSFGKRLVEDES
ncbi:MAG: GNAT family acetyltransferase [Phormidesmis sp.]